MLNQLFNGPLAIFFGVLVGSLLMASHHLANGGEIRTSKIDSNGTPHKSISFLSKAGAEGWIAGVIAGVSTGLIAYNLVKINVNTMWLAWIFFALVLFGYVYLAFAWYRIGAMLGQGVCFGIVAGVLTVIGHSLATMMSAPWGNNAFSRIFCNLPFLMMVGLIAFMVIDAFNYRAAEGNKDFEKVQMAVKITALVLVVVLIVLSLAGCGGPSVEAVENAYDQQNLSVQKLTPEDLEKLTLTKYKDIQETLLDSSLSPKDKERTSKTGMSDALTFGFESKDTTKMFKKLETEILRNPVYGVAVANALRSKKIGDQAIGDLNGWMNEMVQKNSKGVFVWCEYRGNDTKVIYVTEEYRCYAATLCTFLERLVEQGVQSHQTIENWCLNSAAKNNDRAGIMAEYQYKKDAFVLAYIPKSEAGKKDARGLFVIGFNVHDKRPEFFDKEDPPEVVNVPTPTDPDPDNPPTPTSPDNPPTPTDPDNPPSPTTTPDPGPDPTDPTSTVKQKDPADDPVNNGNAQKGGGDNKPSDGSGEYQAQDPRTEKQDPADVKPDTPAVVPEHKAEEQAGQIVDHENKMDYEPDPVTDRGPVNSQKPVTSSNGDGEFVPD
ncbi:hypothetical protein IIY68_01765 [Candidatus Saccharibacteria bacterium]|nr:hypothetical protein [Candidatus Saccharibacteria bacterium]